MLDLSSLYLVNASLALGFFALPFLVPGVHAQLRDLGAELDEQRKKLKAQRDNPLFAELRIDIGEIDDALNRVRHQLRDLTFVAPRLIHPHRFWYDNLLPVVALFMVAGLLMTSVDRYREIADARTRTEHLAILTAMFIVVLVICGARSRWQKHRSLQRLTGPIDRPRTTWSLVFAGTGLAAWYVIAIDRGAGFAGEFGAAVPIVFVSCGAAVWTTLLWRAQYRPYSKLSSPAMLAQRLRLETAAIERVLDRALLDFG